MWLRRISWGGEIRSYGGGIECMEEVVNGDT